MGVASLMSRPFSAPREQRDRARCGSTGLLLWLLPLPERSIRLCPQRSRGRTFLVVIPEVRQRLPEHLLREDVKGRSNSLSPVARLNVNVLTMSVRGVVAEVGLSDDGFAVLHPDV